MQSRTMSMVEAWVNVLVGIGLSYALNAALHEALNIQMSTRQNVLLTGAFTVLSLVRSYTLRRIFNGWRPKLVRR
jgi:hypothetical protein